MRQTWTDVFVKIELHGGLEDERIGHIIRDLSAAVSEIKLRSEEKVTLHYNVITETLTP